MTKLIYFCLLALGLNLFSPLEAQSPVPENTRIIQQAVWKEYQLKLMVSPAQPNLKQATYFFIEARHAMMRKPFPGSISIGFEKISALGFPFQESLIAPNDYVEQGLAKVNYQFEGPGKYAVIASFTDDKEEMYILRGQIDIAEEGFWVENKKAIFIASASLLLLMLFFLWKKNKH